MAKVSAADVARKLLDAVRSDSFYIYSHPQALGSVQTRLEDVMLARNPSDPFAARPDVVRNCADSFASRPQSEERVGRDARENEVGVFRDVYTKCTMPPGLSARPGRQHGHLDRWYS